MRKKIGMWLMAGLLLLQPVSVQAAPEDNSVIRAVSGYCLGDELHTFIQIRDEYDVNDFKASLQSDAVSAAGDEQSPVPVTETSSIVRYVFMIDLTGSMRRYAEEVNEFVDSLMETERLEAFYTVAAFGERFEIVSENLTDKNAVKKVLEELKYTEKLTDPYTGVESALTYLDGYSIRSGDLLHLVVITDGDPDLGLEDGEESRETESALAESVTQRLESTPEIIVSTICTAEWDECAFQALSTGSGIHEMIGDGQDAGAAGEKMADYVDSLYRLSFRLSAAPVAERFSVELRLRGNEPDGQRAMLNVSLEGVPDLKLFSHNGQEAPGSGEGSGGLGEIVGNGNDRKPDGEKPETGDIKEPGDGEAAGPEGADGEAPGDGMVPEGADAEEPGDGEAAGPEGADAEEAKQGIDPKLLLAVGVCACALALVGILVVLLMGKRNSRRLKPQPEAKGGAGAAAGIMMKLEVYSGSCVSRPASICLADSLLIGSAPECDLVFSDTDVSPQNSRIFVQNQMIYIEDLNSEEGTAIGGMRIQGQNRLRSGDVISIGNVEFCFKF